MKTLRITSLVLALTAPHTTVNAQVLPFLARDSSVVTIHAAAMIDGRGHRVANALITVHGSKIEKVETGNAASGRMPTYELGDATLLPGLIDAHVHPGWYINRQGALHNNRDGETPAQSALARAGNLYSTLMAGFTTIQSVGGAEDID